MSAQDVVIIPAKHAQSNGRPLDFVLRALIGAAPAIMREMHSRWRLQKMMELDSETLADFGVERSEIAYAIQQPITHSASKALDAKRAARAWH